MDNHILIKLIDLIHSTKELKSSPNLICQQSRVTCEAILKEIYKKEVGPLPPKIMFQNLYQKIEKESPGAIPNGIMLCITTIQAYGNNASHAQDDLDQLDDTAADIVEKALGKTCNWFFNEYIKIENSKTYNFDAINPVSSKAKQCGIENYKTILMDVLNDGILEFHEYESVIEARNMLELNIDQIEKIERETINELTGKRVRKLSDILEDSKTDSIIYEKNNLNYPLWATDAIDKINKLSCPEWQTYLNRFISAIKSKDTPYNSSVLPLLGGWQGWFAQSGKKTYFNLFFIVKNNNEITGLSIEPIDPTWSKAPPPNVQFLLAELNGSLVDDILFTYTKKYTLHWSHEIKYEGVIIDEGKYFEGEWSIGESLNGAFNAMKTKSLLPIRIFNTDDKKPLVKTIFFNHFNKLMSSWFVQLRGKDFEFLIFHLLELSDKVLANIVSYNNNEIKVLFYQGNKIDKTINIYHYNNEGVENKNDKISFAIDWNSNTISGTARSIKFPIRSLKGFKI